MTIAVWAILPATLNAQESQDKLSAESAEALDTVVVLGEAWENRLQLDSESSTGSRLGLSLRETPAVIDVLTQEQMQALGAHTTLDALNRVPGMYAASVATSPGLLALRGFSDGAVSLLYDGARPAVPAFFTRVQDSWMFDRIEVLKGPSSVLYGEGGAGWDGVSAPGDRAASVLWPALDWLTDGATPHNWRWIGSSDAQLQLQRAQNDASKQISPCTPT